MRMASVSVGLKRAFVTAGVIVMAAGNVSAGSASDPVSLAEGCARQFEEAQRIDMEAFRDYDAETFRAGHHPGAVTVFASGDTFIGIDAIMEALGGFHFGRREAIWTWTERYRIVDGCKSAFILYETVYELPSIGFRERALTGVTYTHAGGKWLGIADQGTPLP